MTRADLQARRDATAAQLADLDALLALPDSALDGVSESPDRTVTGKIVAYVRGNPGCLSREIVAATSCRRCQVHAALAAGRLACVRVTPAYSRFYIPGAEPKEP